MLVRSIGFVPCRFERLGYSEYLMIPTQGWFFSTVATSVEICSLSIFPSHDAKRPKGLQLANIDLSTLAKYRIVYVGT